MPAASGELYRFIVFIPHANVRAEFNKYRRELFASGFAAAYSFPAAAPVALVQAPASMYELRRMAALFRERSYENSAAGRIQTASISSAYLPNGKIIAGPRLSIETPPIPESVSVIATFPELILGVGVFPERQRQSPLRLPLRLPPTLQPPISFSAAALANMTLRPLEYETSYSWTIGEPQWLPARNSRRE
ncbi:MAG: hypothetical protein LBJ35_06550 [Spirochaetaceae bacterium]|jgi:hypothetical protein|nr:hypothetical protein [Spirochaetaceae bacterium]